MQKNQKSNQLSSVEPAGTAPPLRILLVEDHEDTLRILSRLLKATGRVVHSAATVREAMEVAEHQTLDMVISDIGLPDGTGLDLIRRLRQHRPIRGIALSGFGSDKDICRSKEAGFEEHLTKPVDFARLDEVITRVAGAIPA